MFGPEHNGIDAEVAELADAQGSGLCGLTPVRVRLPPSAFIIDLPVCRPAKPMNFPAGSTQVKAGKLVVLRIILIKKI